MIESAIGNGYPAAALLFIAGKLDRDCPFPTGIPVEAPIGKVQPGEADIPARRHAKAVAHSGYGMTSQACVFANDLKVPSAMDAKHGAGARFSKPIFTRRESDRCA